MKALQKQAVSVLSSVRNAINQILDGYMHPYHHNIQFTLDVPVRERW